MLHYAHFVKNSSIVIMMIMIMIMMMIIVTYLEKQRI